jgi:hypothetical protein
MIARYNLSKSYHMGAVPRTGGHPDSGVIRAKGGNSI